MTKNKINFRILLFTFILLFFLNIIVLFLLFKPDHKVEIINNSDHYTISLNNRSMEFLLNSWGFWNQNKIQLETLNKKYTVKSIKINFVNREQPYYKEEIILPNNQQIVRSSVNYRIDRSQTLKLNIYINSSYVSYINNLELSEFVNHKVIEVLYRISHIEQNDEQKFNNINEIYSNLNKKQLIFNAKKGNKS